MKLFKQGGWWLPDHEAHLQEWMLKKNDFWDGRLAYQGAKIRRALDLTFDRRRTVIDIGAHCGLWAYYLATRFDRYVGFEPIEEHRMCFMENLPPTLRVGSHVEELHPCALGDEEGFVGMHTEPSSSGDSYPNGKGTTPVRRLDTFGLSFVDLIKVDCEGYEYFALHGGEELIKACRPVIVVEQKPGKAQKYGLSETHAVQYLESLGMRLHSEMAGDFFLTWPAANH